ncbi:hypothetical protein AN1V17_16640 [Vallitalea sediminicola]
MYEKITKTIKLAKVRCMSEEDLLNTITTNPLSLYNKYPNEVKRLSELKLSANAITRLKILIDQIIVDGEKVKSKDKYKADNYLRKLVELMPLSYQYEYALEFIKHNRKNRREKGIQLLKYHDFNSKELENILGIAKRNYDMDLLKIIIRNISIVNIIQEDILFLIYNVDDNYWKCRIIEETIKKYGFNSFTIKIVNSNPIATIRAMGRTENVEYLEFIMPIIYNYFDDEEVLGLLFWALGKIKAIEIINKLELKLNAYLNVL